MQLRRDATSARLRQLALQQALNVGQSPQPVPAVAFDRIQHESASNRSIRTNGTP